VNILTVVQRDGSANLAASQALTHAVAQFASAKTMTVQRSAGAHFRQSATSTIPGVCGVDETKVDNKFSAEFDRWGCLLSKREFESQDVF
jgi:hypothetical protein